jgi:hypothetical protein
MRNRRNIAERRHEGAKRVYEKDPIETGRAMYPAEEGMLELPARGVLRVFVPMRNSRVRRGGSRLYPALSWKGRAYRMALRAWITSGGARFTHRPTAKHEEGWPLGELLRSDMPTLSTAAVSIGPPSPGQKITAQLMDDRGRILGYAKYADRPLTRTRVLNEAQMLRMLPERVGPRLVRLVPFMEGDLLVQTPLPGRSRRPRLQIDAAQMRLLGRLIRSEDPHPASEHPFIRTLHAQAGHHGWILESIVAALGNGKWQLAYMHGDLAPWNVRWWQGECMAFDWECGWRAGFAYVDAAYALIQVASIIRRLDPCRASQVVSDRLGALLPTPYNESASTIAALGALYTLLSWYPPAERIEGEPSPQEQWLRTFAEAAL